MIDVPVNSNTVYVFMIQTGYLKEEFDSTYPIHLNGIISQDEFRESIKRINHTIALNKIGILLVSIFALSIIGGMLFFIILRIIQAIAIVTFGLILFGIGYCIAHFRGVPRIRQTIAEESMKYSSRSPIPCSWRLETTRDYFAGYGNRHNSQLLVIDIGHGTVPGHRTYYSNQVANESILFFEEQDNIAHPPYSSQSAGFCSQCDAPRHDLIAKFCSSCRQSFNKYEIISF